MARRLKSEAIERLVDDLGRADLGDPRRNARGQAILQRLGVRPDASLPDALVTAAELEGAYRFFNNEAVTFEQLFDAHAVSAAERARSTGAVLAIHDTTTCVFKHADAKDVGYLNTGKPGFLLHLTMLVDARTWRRPLGLAHAEIIRRDKPPRRRNTKHRTSSAVTGKQTDSEFARWHRGIDATEARLAGATTQVIHVADRESDAYALMATCLAEGRRFIFRARTNRTVLDGGERVSIRQLIGGADVMLEREVPLSRRLAAPAPRMRRAHPPRESRVATLHFAQTRTTFQRPTIAPSHLPRTIDVNVVHVFEPSPPTGEEPVDWLLYTTEPVATRTDVETVVDAYRCRWMIEELHKALKTGCVVQERQLESRHALTTMLALSLPIAVELLALRALARTAPATPATELLHPEQLAALRHLSAHRELPATPTAQDALWCIAGLGGHIKNNGPAGWQVLQRGMAKFLEFAAGWCAARGVDL